MEKLDFLTGLGYEEGKEKEVTIVTNLAVFKVGKDGFVLKSVHPNVKVEDVTENMSFSPIVKEVTTTPKPTDEELKLIDKLDPDGVRFSEFKR